MLDRSEESIPSVSLESITTSSLDALKDFLQAERHFRAGEYDAAVERYRQAVDRDPTFALAHKRLGRSITWSGRPEDSGPPLKRAYELSERLPLRERRLVWAQYAWKVEGRRQQAIDSLRRWTRTYPDDPSLYYELGEVLFHSGVPRRWSRAEKALEKATRLDPGLATYHHHLVQLAFSLHRDSALAASRIEAHPEGKVKTLYEAYWDLRFGPPARRRGTWARLDSLALPALPTHDLVVWPFAHPLDLHLQTKLLRTVRARNDGGPKRKYNALLLKNLLQRGKIQAATSLFRKHEKDPPPELLEKLLRSLRLDYPLPDSLFRPYLEPSELGEDVSGGHLVLTGIYLIEQGRGEELPRVLDQIRKQKTEETEHMIEGTINELKGYRAWKEGRLEEASRLWAGTIPAPIWHITRGALWRGDLNRELGNLREAEGWYLSAWSHPVAHERLGQLYEEMGRPEDAAAAYHRFVAAWEEADPELQPRIEEARQRLNMLGQPDAGE